MAKAGPSLKLLGWLEEQTDLTPAERTIVLRAYYALRDIEMNKTTNPIALAALRDFERSGLAAGRAE